MICSLDIALGDCLSPIGSHAYIGYCMYIPDKVDVDLNVPSPRKIPGGMPLKRVGINNGILPRRY